RVSSVAGTDSWAVRGPCGKEHLRPTGGRLRVDHGLAAREAIAAGRGIAAAHQRLVGDLLASGAVKPVLPGYGLPPAPLNMLIVPERAGIARVRLLIDFLAEHIGALPGIEAPRRGR